MNGPETARWEAPLHTERFAPSPTGRLHLGHAFSALTAFAAARAAGGRFLLRIEDLDRGRAREAFVAGIFEDLAWLGIDWDGPALLQSDRLEAHAAALAALERQGLTYRCRCTRRDIAEAAAAPQEGAAPAAGPDGPVYPGTCRGLGLAPGEGLAVRLDMARALAALEGRPLGFEETGAGPAGETGHIPLDPAALLAGVGDVVLARRDGAPAYHLAVVVDDAFQQVTHVTRGADLFPATPIHRLLQALLGLPVPVWHHHRLIRDEAGRRLAKRDDARALASLRAEGATPADIRARLGLA
ncbi:tRNA glutamyl-Q(34) synthetase GluQRS [Paralimibaculum aggregatum]|uniref:tRNA glutamyl-Q(34) synthetase GluQRS n=1 Tax=Paralimibaculum aggregatum TaxID=3036245 RepID=A0ABQ6LN89_9RHOB|nr:tRNA glutamyl-Q(34) synthetase GluQRS [Limibaculum sp. NKW23]GMG84462.1 tRNA glutamyl-Q(34) synthetase GluQRS [Limibaculum sp. NKW23]